MRLRIDLHVHSVRSPDSLNTVEALNARCRSLGLDGYAVCDHDILPELKEADGDVLVIPGMEVSARGGHVLCYLPSGPVPAKLSVPETVDRIHAQGSTAVLAHPYGLPRSWVSIREAEAAGLDAVEVANSAQWPYWYIRGKNQKLSERLRLPQTGGSDSHIPDTFGRAYTEVEAEEATAEAVLKAIRGGHTSPVDGATTWRERARKWIR